ncbi:MAG: hypothetical protein ACQEWW_23130 [Bacillota bacterium]
MGFLSKFFEDYYELILHNDFPEFKQYILEFVLVPEKKGIHNLNDLKVVIETNKNKYEENIGKWTFNVSDSLPSDSLIIEGGSVFSEWNDRYDTLEYRTELTNKSSETILLSSLEHDNKHIEISQNDFVEKIEPGEKLTIKNNVEIINNYRNLYFKPRLLYSLNNKEHILPLNLTIFASTVPSSELDKLLIEKKMVKK